MFAFKIDHPKVLNIIQKSQECYPLALDPLGIDQRSLQRYLEVANAARRRCVRHLQPTATNGQPLCFFAPKRKASAVSYRSPGQVVFSKRSFTTPEANFCRKKGGGQHSVHGWSVRQAPIIQMRCIKSRDSKFVDHTFTNSEAHGKLRGKSANPSEVSHTAYGILATFLTHLDEVQPRRLQRSRNQTKF